MSQATELHSRLDAGEVLILDGAMGTELERRGAPSDYNVWCAPTLGSNPEMVREVHEAYIDVGADIIITYTFTCGRRALEDAGFGDNVREWNARGAQVAVEAREQSGDRPVYVAGSVSSYGNQKEPDQARLKASYAELAGILADNGVDVILLEMVGTTVERALPAIEAVSGAGLPVWLSVSSAVDRDSGEVMLGTEESQKHSPRATHHEPLAGAVRRLMASGISVLNLMHSDLKAAAPTVQVFKDNCNGAYGAYSNAGRWEPPNWVFVDQVTPDDYLAEAKGWVGMGAQIVGGCCGINPTHIKALNDGLPDRLP